MKLYITPLSPYARFARIVVLEKGLDDRVDIILAQTRVASSPYYTINPSGRVPYLVRDDGIGMEDSALICAYLDHLEGAPAFSFPGRDQAWEMWRLEALVGACWTASPFGEESCATGRKRNGHPPSSNMNDNAAGAWRTCGRGKSSIR